MPSVLARTGAMTMLEHMHISAEAETEIATPKIDRLGPLVDLPPAIDTRNPRPLIASSNVNASDAAYIQSRAPVDIGSDGTVGLKRLLPSASRVLDVIIATALLLVLLPVLAFIAIFLQVFEGGPVIFAHRRVGLDGKTFNCLKFRTMCVDADQRLARLLVKDDAQKLVCDPRVTRFGQILRNTSLDELPQLINVLRGEMSLVGPRPIVEDEMCRYGRHAAKYIRVRPGLTGLWQVTRNTKTSYRRRVATDILYLQKRTLAFDFKILLATVPAVLVGNG